MHDDCKSFFGKIVQTKNSKACMRNSDSKQNREGAVKIPFFNQIIGKCNLRTCEENGLLHHYGTCMDVILINELKSLKRCNNSD